MTHTYIEPKENSIYDKSHITLKFFEFIIIWKNIPKHIMTIYKN